MSLAKKGKLPTGVSGSLHELQPRKIKKRKPLSSRKRSVAYLKKQADKYFSIYIRLRDSDGYGNVKCITCDRLLPWKQAQAGHFVSRRTNTLRYDDENVNAQCVGCNMFKSGEAYQYSLALDLKYGDDTAKKLHDRRHEIHKFTADELQSIIDEAKANISAYDNNH